MLGLLTPELKSAYTGLRMGQKRGQILILVLLIVVVALAVGLSVASRNITNLKTSTQTEQSQRAFTAAEGGIEDVLSQLSDPGAVKTAVDGGSPANVSITGPGGITGNVTVSGSNVYQTKIALGDVGQIDLKNATANEVQIEWGQNNASDELDSGQPATIEVTQLNDNFGIFLQARKAYSSRGESGFDSIAGCIATAPFTQCTRFDLNTIGGSKELLRIKPFHANVTVKVAGVGTPLPIQIIDLDSKANTTTGITRRVQVTRTKLPNVPAVFDYVLFSETDIIK